MVVGNHRLFEERGLCSPGAHASLESLTAEGCSTVMVARGGRTVGVIGVADEPRESAAAVVEMLREQGVAHVVLLTGDHDRAARAVAASAGISEYRASLLPEDKVAAVEDLRRRYGVLAMVGDGVNDAPALATANVGIAMGVAGTDAALETADVALMADELPKIPFAIRLSRAAARNIRMNIAFSLAAEGRVPGHGARRHRHALDGRRRRHGGVADRHRECAALAAGVIFDRQPLPRASNRRPRSSGGSEEVLENKILLNSLPPDLYWF